MPDSRCQGSGMYFCWLGVPHYWPEPPVGIAAVPVVTLEEDGTVTLDWMNAEGLAARSQQSVMRKKKRPTKKKRP